MKSESPILASSPNAPNLFSAFFLAARPKTWIASFSPVFVGVAMAAKPLDYPVFLLTLLFSFLIQVGTNFANDYFDYINGADTSARKGPKRATQEGWISPRAMLRSTFLIFAAAFLIAIPLMARAGLWWSFPLAALCVAFGILYTGGPKPLGYLGLGEILVFVFYGPVAVCGTYFLQTFTLNLPIFIASLAPGLLCCSIIIANNLRDEESDRSVGKTTLIARFGHRFGCWEYTFTIAAAALVPLLLICMDAASLKLASAALILPASQPLIRRAFRTHNPIELMPLLPGSALLLLLYTAIFCAIVW